MFYTGAAAIASGKSPYVGDYVSPPWFALFLAPLTGLPLPVARGVWLALNLGLLLAATHLCAGIAGLRWPTRRLLLATVLFALWPPIEFGLKLGQNSLLSWVLLLGALAAVSVRHYGLAGGLLALSLIKPQLGFLLGGGLAVAAIHTEGLRPMALSGAGVVAVLGLSVLLVAPASYAELLAAPPRTWDYWGSTVALPPLLAMVTGSKAVAILAYLPLALVGAALVLRQWAALVPMSPKEVHSHASSDDGSATVGAGARAASLGVVGESNLAYLAALTTGATLVLTPYAYPYDAVLLQFPLVWLGARLGATVDGRTARRVAICAVWVVGLWLLERPADYTAWRFLGLLPPMALMLALWRARRGLP